MEHLLSKLNLSGAVAGAAFGYLFGAMLEGITGVGIFLVSSTCAVLGAVLGAVLRGHCPLRVMEVDGTETSCMWRAHHGGRCSFEVKCAGHPDRECSKHWGHEPPCDLVGEPASYASEEAADV